LHMRHLETRNELHFPHSSELLYTAFTYYTASSQLGHRTLLRTQSSRASSVNSSTSVPSPPARTNSPDIFPPKCSGRRYYPARLNTGPASIARLLDGTRSGEPTGEFDFGHFEHHFKSC